MARGEMSLPYVEFGLLGRPPEGLNKEAGPVLNWLARKGTALGRSSMEWGRRQGRAARYWTTTQARTVDPRRYQGSYFGRGKEVFRTGWQSMSPQKLLNEYQRIGGSPQALRKLELTNPSLASKIHSVVATVRPNYVAEHALRLTPKQFGALKKSDPVMARRLGAAVRKTRDVKAKDLRSVAGKGGKELSKGEAKTQSMVQLRKKGADTATPEKAKHLAASSQTLREAAKGGTLSQELSRRGWTGQGRVTRYLPVGGKGLTAGFAGWGLHDAVTKKREAGETRGGRVGEEIASSAAYVAGAPFGLPGIIGSSILAGRAGRAVGHQASKVLGEKPAPAQQQPQVVLTPQQRRLVRRAGGAVAQQAGR